MSDEEESVPRNIQERRCGLWPGYNSQNDSIRAESNSSGRPEKIKGRERRSASRNKKAKAAQKTREEELARDRALAIRKANRREAARKQKKQQQQDNS